MNRVRICLIVMAAIISGCDKSNKEVHGVSDIDFVNGVPTSESSKKLYDAMDYYARAYCRICRV
jgi:hypothetical protein